MLSIHYRVFTFNERSHIANCYSAMKPKLFCANSLPLFATPLVFDPVTRTGGSTLPLPSLAPHDVPWRRVPPRPAKRRGFFIHLISARLRPARLRPTPTSMARTWTRPCAGQPFAAPTPPGPLLGRRRPRLRSRRPRRESYSSSTPARPWFSRFCGGAHVAASGRHALEPPPLQVLTCLWVTSGQERTGRRTAPLRAVWLRYQS